MSYDPFDDIRVRPPERVQAPRMPSPLEAWQNEDLHRIANSDNPADAAHYAGQAGAWGAKPDSIMAALQGRERRIQNINEINVNRREDSTKTISALIEAHTEARKKLLKAQTQKQYPNQQPPWEDLLNPLSMPSHYPTDPYNNHITRLIFRVLNLPPPLIDENLPGF